MMLVSLIIYASSVFANCQKQLTGEVMQFKQQIESAAAGAIVDVPGLSLPSILELNSARVDKVGMELSSARLGQAQPTAQAEILKGQSAQEAILESLQDSFTTSLSFLSEAQRAEYRETLLKAMESGHVVELSESGARLGILLVRDFSFKGTPKLLVSWIWRDRAHDARASFKSASIAALQKLSGGKDVVASIHVRNTSSLNFFSNLGFSPICVFLSK